MYTEQVLQLSRQAEASSAAAVAAEAAREHLLEEVGQERARWEAAAAQGRAWAEERLLQLVSRGGAGDPAVCLLAAGCCQRLPCHMHGRPGSVCCCISQTQTTP